MRTLSSGTGIRGRRGSTQGYYEHYLASSTAQANGDSSRNLRCVVGSRFVGPASRKPPRAATACPAAGLVLPIRLAVADGPKIPDRSDILEEMCGLAGRGPRLLASPRPPLLPLTEPRPPPPSL